ncbi:MAG: 16S rRNA (uracil(1498)-N(3))-methyltransferase [Candidatus Omnitrophica bacterium]|nr:16S rRNA (uracil(1498)-N(3))-methyltransferase [Candidatus Omnitrophota bacterium]
MREKRFFVSKSDIKGNSALLSPQESHHLKNVLRLKKGDSVIVFNGEGQEFAATVTSMSSRVGVQLDAKRRQRFTEAVTVALAQAMPKKKKMDFIIAKASELGVREIFPLETERSSFKLTGPQAPRVQARWEKISVQTSKQCHLDWIPALNKPVKMKDLLQRSKEFAAVLIPHTEPSLPSFSEAVSELKEKLNLKSQPPAAPYRILLVIGPEGGFSEKEIALAREKGAYLVQMGDLVLKTETAAIVGIALVKYAFNL